MRLAYKNIFAILYLLFIVGVSLLATLGVHSFLGESFNLITINVLPVVIVLAAADAIHLLTGFYAQKNETSNVERITEVYKKIFYSFTSYFGYHICCVFFIDV